MFAVGFTDVGEARSQNEDNIFVSDKQIGPFPNLFIVADGMGGHNAGEIASKMAVDLFSGFIRDFGAGPFIQPEHYLDLMISASKHANDEIFKKSQADETMQGMGTTLTAAVIAENKVYLAHIGDSRAYAINVHGIKQLTTDHTFVEELLKTGRVSEEEASSHPRRHVLTKVLGVSENSEVDGLVSEVEKETSILLCSDGLTNMLNNESIMKLVNGLGPAEHRASYLVNEANKQGGADNISVILIDVGKK